MIENKFAEYVELFSQFYDDKIVQVKWGKGTAAFRAVVNLEEELNKIDTRFKEEEFVDVAFTVLRVVRDLSNGLTPDDKEKARIIIEKFIKDRDILEHVRVHTTSVTNTYEDIDYEITAKRSKENPSQIIGTSVIISLMYNQPMKPDITEKFSIELTRKELNDLIKQLGEIERTINYLDR